MLNKFLQTYEIYDCYCSFLKQFFLRYSILPLPIYSAIWWNLKNQVGIQLKYHFPYELFHNSQGNTSSPMSVFITKLLALQSNSSACRVASGLDLFWQGFSEPQCSAWPKEAIQCLCSKSSMIQPKVTNYSQYVAFIHSL